MSVENNKICVICNTPFYAKRSDAAVCSPKCGQTHYRNKIKTERTGMGQSKILEELLSLREENLQLKLKLSNLIDKAESKESTPLRDIDVYEHNNTIFKQIAAVHAEVIPPARNTIIGKRAWHLDQQKRIQDLQNKLRIIND